jgi:hypothetical protein
VRVCSPSAHGNPCEPTANIYSDPSLTIPKNSTDTDTDGDFSFYAKPGMYDLQVTGDDSSSQLVPVAVLPTSGIPTPSNVIVSRGTGFSLSLSGNLVVSGSVTAQQGVTAPAVTIGSPSNTGVPPSHPSVGSVTLFTGTDGLLYYEDSSGNIFGPVTTQGGGGAPPTGSPIQYVASTGRDRDDGLTWGSAKQTVMAAYDALPPNGGSILIMQAADGSGIPATSTPGQGIWIMASNDPNYSHPPPGWRRAKLGGVVFQGVAATSHSGNSHLGGQVIINGGSALSRNQPCIWIAGGTNYLFENLDCQGGGRGIVVGESSTNLRDGTTNVTGTTFENVATEAWGEDSVDGPAVDITGGSFWLYFRDCVFFAMYDPGATAESLLDNRHAAMLIDGTGNPGNGLIYVDNLNANGGGIKYIPGYNGGNLTVNGMTEEGASAPAIHVTSTNYGTIFNFENIIVADPFSSAAVAVQIDGNGPAGAVLVTGSIEGPVIGPATVMGQILTSVVNTSVSPAQMGQDGIVNGHLVGQTDVSRRNFGPVAIRYPNIVSQVAANWTVTQFAGTTTLTTGVAAPDGTHGAGRVTSTVSAPPQECLFFYNGLVPVTTGDYFIGGAWLRSLASTGGYGNGRTIGIAFSPFDSGTGKPYSLTGNVNGAINGGQNEWTWQYFIFKIVGGVSTSPAQVAFLANFDLNFPTEAYAPVMMHIPAGDISDNEAYEIATNLSTFADGLPAGTVATLRGQTFAFGGTGNFFGLLSQSNTANRTYIFPDASGPVALTNNPQTWAATQTFDSVNLTNPTIDGQAMSHVPIGIFPAFLPGALTTFYTAATFTPEFGILVTGVEVSVKTAPQSCAVNAVIQVSGSNVAQVTLSSSQSDSGPLSISMDGGTPIKIVLVPAQTCLVTPQDLNVTVRYRMQ